MNHDPVNHPKHYATHKSGVECIALTRQLSFSRGNALKYLFRYEDKENPLQDLKKALWYLKDEFTRVDALKGYQRDLEDSLASRVSHAPFHSWIEAEGDTAKARIIAQIWPQTTDTIAQLTFAIDKLEHLIANYENTSK